MLDPLGWAAVGVAFVLAWLPLIVAARLVRRIPYPLAIRMLFWALIIVSGIAGSTAMAGEVNGSILYREPAPGVAVLIGRFYVLAFLWPYFLYLGWYMARHG